MQLGLVTDELSLDPETAMELAAAWGIHCFELRKVWTSRCPDFDDFALASITRSLRAFGGRITALSPGLFKLPLRSTAVAAHVGERLERTIAMAERLEVPYIITFGVERSASDRAEDYDEVVGLLGEAAEQVRRRGLTLIVEPEPGFWADTGANTFRLLQDVPGLMLNFDPGNMAAAGDTDMLASYRLLRPYIKNVHVKDVVRRPDGTRSWAVPGAAGCLVDWKGLLAALIADGYAGVLSLETHVSPRIAATQASLRYCLEEGQIQIAPLQAAQIDR